VIAAVVIVTVAAAAAAATVLLRGPVRFADAITAPAQFGAFTAKPALARKMDAAGLRRQIIAQSNGEAHNVVDTVYESAAGRGNRSASDILLFIGGNLSGTSATAFISSFRDKATGAVPASAGAMGGKAACIPAADGGLAECAWADQDTFGVVASPTLNTAQLAADLLTVRAAAEHPARR
jgi:hypothetical protein